MKIMTSFKFWGVLLIFFVVIILWDGDIDTKVAKTYIKQKMNMENVHFNQMDQGFEQARLYADVINMDDHQNNMLASHVRVIMFKKEVATWSAILLSDQANKNPFEAKFWGNVRGHTSEEESFRTEEFRYFLKRKEIFTQKPITIWKGNAVITGKGFRYKTVAKEAQILQQVKIRIWNEPASKTIDISSKTISTSTSPISPLPVAPHPSELLLPFKKMTRPASTSSDTVLHKGIEKDEK